MIIGNSFLFRHNALIDFKNRTITLDKCIVAQLFNKHNNDTINNIKEKIGNSFEINNNYSIAHCISADLKMSKGIAADIKSQFGDSTAIHSHLKPRVGEAIPVKQNNKLIYYLKPRTVTLQNQLMTI